MGITVVEKAGSRIGRAGEEETTELLFVIRGTADDSEALDALLEDEDGAPPTYRGLVRKSVGVEPVHVDETDPDGSIWDGRADYGTVKGSPLPKTGESTFSFDTGGGTQHITQSLDTIGKWALPGATPTDFQGAIGVADGTVEGVDIVVPVYSFSETHYLADATLTGAYKAKLFALTGKTNNGIFKGFAIGEVLFLGASGSKRGEEDWEITFRFAASPNRTNFTVGSISVGSKRGWQYMWIRYADDADPNSKRMAKRPVEVYVEKVYEDGNFADLGIGT